VIAEHKHLAEHGAKLVELRLDYITTAVNLKRLLDDRPGPVVVTIRRERDGGNWVRSEDDRLMLLRQAIAMGVEYVDLEDDIAASIPRFGKTKRIVSYHNFQETPENLSELHAKLAALNADVVKLATMAHSPHDNLRMLRLSRDAQSPTVAICMGDIGTPSRILAAKFKAPFTYAASSNERSLAPGQLSWDQMRQVYRYEEINGETEIYGVIADPVAHSLSPLVHNLAFKALKLNKAYLPFRVPRENLAQFMEDCKELGVQGLSVTIPHKEDVLARLAKTDEATQEIGACNTVVWKDGKALGYNTDYRAAMNGVDELFGGNEAQSGIARQTALMLGSGGVAKAIALGLRRRGADVVIASRTLARAEELAQRCGARAVPWEQRQSVQGALVVNCTPVGMHPHVDESPLDAVNLRPQMTVFDTVYNPESTLLVKQARDAGCRVMTGVDMFVAQAALQFKLFAGQQAPVEAMRQVVRRAISAVKV
jgi:3-dehydroquinate dehydratase/shikimate dehydrogenase